MKLFTEYLELNETAELNEAVNLKKLAKDIEEVAALNKKYDVATLTKMYELVMSGKADKKKFQKELAIFQDLPARHEANMTQLDKLSDDEMNELEKMCNL